MDSSFRLPDHLPNRRPDRQPPDPAGLPRQRRGITPQRHGRYPDYDVLAMVGALGLAAALMRRER